MTETTLLGHEGTGRTTPLPGRAPILDVPYNVIAGLGDPPPPPSVALKIIKALEGDVCPEDVRGSCLCGKDPEHHQIARTVMGPLSEGYCPRCWTGLALHDNTLDAGLAVSGLCRCCETTWKLWAEPKLVVQMQPARAVADGSPHFKLKSKDCGHRVGGMLPWELPGWTKAVTHG